MKSLDFPLNVFLIKENMPKSRYPRRRCKAHGGMYAGQDGELDTGAEVEEESNTYSSDDLGEDEADFKRLKVNRRLKSKNIESKPSVIRRTSSRANKFNASMAEPRLTDLPRSPKLEIKQTRTALGGKRTQKSREEVMTEADELEKTRHNEDNDNGDDEEETNSESHVPLSASSASPDLRDTDESSVEEEDPLKMQRIIGSKSLRRRDWKAICAKMNTVEVDSGSVWHQKDCEDEDKFEERFLVKWSGLSYLHCSWETERDLDGQIENSKTYLNTFFRKSIDGCLFTPDQRCDGEYFDPAYTQIDRILAVTEPDDFSETSPEEEDKLTHSDLGIVTDKSDPKYEEGLGRQFFVKWCNQPYTESSYEWERDLIMNDIDYKSHLKHFLSRSSKPTKQWVRSHLREGDATRRKLYKTFGDKTTVNEESRSHAVTEYQKSLREHIYKNGGQLRDYQAEGVSWMIANYINSRSCILAGMCSQSFTSFCQNYYSPHPLNVTSTQTRWAWGRHFR